MLKAQQSLSLHTILNLQFSKSKFTCLFQNEPIRLGKEEFACPFCHHLEKSAWHCRRHVTIHHTTERPFACSYCPYTSKQKCDLKKHEKNCFRKLHQQQQNY